MEPPPTSTEWNSGTHFVLASRSPRRRELLASLAPAARIEIVPPPSAEEPGFHDCHSWPAIERQIAAIARSKSDTVNALCTSSTDRTQAVLIAADTEIVVDDGTGRLQVLGQPPETDAWRDVVRDWFIRFYSGRPHWAVSALCVRFPDGRTVESRTRTEVEFRSDVLHWLPWYLDTGESRGKAGGYAIQGAGSVFVARVTGSLSNVVGLPLESLLSALEGTPR